MGELGIGIKDLIGCPDCGANHTMMFESPKEEWYIVCGNHKCCRKTEHHPELLDAASEWGLL